MGSKEIHSWLQFVLPFLFVAFFCIIVIHGPCKPSTPFLSFFY
uniref:Transmembrane protein n=1 Tax=Rhizophora mucronata TaxID=61149 RepID=A0A2P2INX4_RHIMU